METNNLYGKFQGQTTALGNISVEKHWRDVAGVHLGGDYAIVPNLLTLSTGVFYQTALADSSYANVDFATGAQLGGTIGASFRWHNQQVALAYEYRREATVALSETDSRVYQTAPLSPCQPPYTDKSKCSPYYPGMPGPPVNAGTYQASSHLFVLDWLYRL